MNTDEKKCPYCAEIIKLEAIICRHCRSNVSNNTNESNNAKENLHSYEEPIRIDRDFEPKWNIRLGKQVITDRDALEISNLIASGTVDIFTEIQRVGTSRWKQVREEPELMILAQKYLPTDRYQSRNTNQESGGSYFVKGLSTLISIILIVGLLITNPSKVEFIDYLNHKISGGLQRLLTKEGFNEKTKGVMSTITQGIAKLALARLIKEQNFYLFHIYEIDTTLIRLVDADIPKFKFIGVANQFIPLHAEEWKKFIAKYGNNVSNNTNTDTSSSSNTRPQVPQQTNPSQPRNDQPTSANLFQSTPPLPKTDERSVLNGKWFSQAANYGYLLTNGVGVATQTNSSKFNIGDKIIELTSTGNNSFQGQQIYQNGKFYPIRMKLISQNRLLVQGESNVSWYMDRETGNPIDPDLPLTPPPWDHNGSKMSVTIINDVLNIHYIEPRKAMMEVGARMNSLLLDGKVTGDIVTGTARIFAQKCGVVTYPVTGSITSNQQQILVVGMAPVINRQTCEVTKMISDPLLFNIVD